MNLKYKYYRAKFYLAPYLPLSFPVHVDLELSGKCNLRCTMCPFGDHEDETGSFDTSMQGMINPLMAETALREARREGALSVKLNFRGEPGLSPHLINMTKLAKELGFVDIMVNTNLVSMGKKRLKDLCDAGLTTLIVSIDGATKVTYESIRLRSNFERLVENMKYIQTLPIKPKVKINMVVQDKNRHEVELMNEVFGGLCDGINFQPIRLDNSGERKPCPQPHQRLVVMWDGQVGACCSQWQNEAVIGQYPEQSLKEIWDSNEHKKLLYYAKDPNRGGPCQGCLVGGSYK